MQRMPQNTQEQVSLRLANGRFGAGRSGNPGGRPRVLADVQALARSLTAEAISTLIDIATNDSARAAARVAAANAILDRGWGRSAQSFTVDRERPPMEPVELQKALDSAIQSTLPAMLSQLQNVRQDMASVVHVDPPVTT
jgi:hypothetical protein